MQGSFKWWRSEPVCYVSTYVLQHTYLAWTPNATCKGYSRGEVVGTSGKYVRVATHVPGVLAKDAAVSRRRVSYVPHLTVECPEAIHATLVMYNFAQPRRVHYREDELCPARDNAEFVANVGLHVRVPPKRQLPVLLELLVQPAPNVLSHRRELDSMSVDLGGR